MKKLSTIIISSAMVLALMGCGEVEIGSDTNAEGPSSTLNYDDSNSTTDAGEVKAELTDDQFIYNNNVISILDDTQTSLANLGDYNKERSNLDKGGAFKRYDYGKKRGDILLDTFEIDGEELVAYILNTSSDIETARGISNKSTEDDVIAAYGEPTEKISENSDYLTYEFDGYSISFEVSPKDKKLLSIQYTNTPNYDRIKNAPKTT